MEMFGWVNAAACADTHWQGSMQNVIDKNIGTSSQRLTSVASKG
jgi:hypothetical protein